MIKEIVDIRSQISQKVNWIFIKSGKWTHNKTLKIRQIEFH